MTTSDQTARVKGDGIEKPPRRRLIGDVDQRAVGDRLGSRVD